MEFRILGPLDIVTRHGRIAIKAQRQKAVLAMLLLEAGRFVPTERLIEALWENTPPATARGQVHICVSMLRRLMTMSGVPNSIVTNTHGYSFQVVNGILDFQVFEELVRAGRTATEEHRLADAVDAWSRALALWRGEPLADVNSRVVQAAAVRLTERRLSTVEQYFDARLRLGAHLESINELMELVEAHPFRERLRVQLMLALHRSGQRAKALEVYRAGRDLLVEELGLEPGEELRRTEHAILADEPVEDATPSQPGVDLPTPVAGEARLQPLPPAITDFTGRREFIARLREILAPPEAGDRPCGSGIAVISGKAGVGKTTLALHLAHQLGSSFSGGRLYANLTGSTRRPAVPSQVLGRFLGMLGVADAAIPVSMNERVQLYRRLLAERQAMIVLDDAADEQQVRPLLPADAGCRVLLTTRARLAALPGIHEVEVGVFPPEQALEFLAVALGADRVMAQRTDALKLVNLCGALPLALRVAACRLAARPHWTVRCLVELLKDEKRRLSQLVYGELKVRAGIASTYERFGGGAQRLFRRLGMLETPDFPGWVAAPLLGKDVEEAQEALESLVDARLVDVDVSSDHATRFRLDELVRVYARERLAADELPRERQEALDRLLCAWLFLAEEAHRREYGGDSTILHGSAPRWRLPVSLVDRLLRDSLSWFERERQSVVSAVRQAAEAGAHELCWDLAMTATTSFESHGCFDDWRTTHELALEAVRIACNRRGEAAILYSLGALGMSQGRFEEARLRLTSALRRFERLGEAHGRALTKRELAGLDQLHGRLDAAVTGYEDALGTLRSVGDEGAVADALGSLAQAYLDLEQPEKAEPLLLEAVAISATIPSRRLRAQVTYLYGNACLLGKRFKAAKGAFGEVLKTIRDQPHRLGEAYPLYGLGRIETRRGRYRQAERLLRQAAAAAQRSGDRLASGQIHLALAEVHGVLGDLVSAEGSAIQALELFGQLDARLWRIRAAEVLDKVGGQVNDPHVVR